MPATDSPAIIVARFLKSSNYTEVSQFPYPLLVSLTNG